MKPVSIYVHIPFCEKKCSYCDFNSIPVKSDELTGKYVKTIFVEIEYYKQKLSDDFIVDTIYFGGGTPSLIDAKCLSEINQKLSFSFKLRPKIETTIEANPGTISPEKLKSYKSFGINRLSIGAQSFIDEELKLLGRIHSSKDIIKAYDTARAAGFSNVSLDLIYGLPNQKFDDLLFSLNRMIKLDPEHISTYSLTVEKGTILSKLIKAKKLPKPDEEAQTEFFKEIIKRLTSSGYPHYEISNFAKTGFESKHNRSYWTGKDYIGMGAGAHSYIKGVRYANNRDILKYINGAKKVKQKILSAEERYWEDTALALRLLSSVDLKKGALHKNTIEKKLQPLINQGLLTYKDGHLKLTDRGILFYDTVAVELI